MTTTRYHPAATSALDRVDSPTTCQCCGREGLKKTVKMTDGVAVVWMGTGCAAKAMGVGVSEYQRGAKAVQKVADDAERSEREAEHRADDAAWQAHLDALVPSLHGDRFRQIQSLGGFRVARASFEAVREATTDRRRSGDASNAH